MQTSGISYDASEHANIYGNGGVSSTSGGGGNPGASSGDMMVVDRGSAYDGGSAGRYPVHMEVVLDPSSGVQPAVVKSEVLQTLQGNPNETFADLNFLRISETVRSNTKFISLGDMPQDMRSLRVGEAEIFVYVYRLSSDGVSEEYTDESEESVSSCQQWVLPAREFHGLWENLIYDIDVKKNLVQYCATAMLFSDANVDSNIISWNRVVLLHGPPGTGKTSLCKALAHKLSVRLSERYSNALLLEINAHSLFSKWFSESGKLVMKLFQHINDLVDDEEALVCVLIDEVESLTAARTSAMSGSEPSDAIRVVNALLTQIDQLRERENVLILTTSNISEAIDLAFVDRADIKQYIGLPNARARYDILASCLRELSRVGIISPAEEFRSFKTAEDGNAASTVETILMNAAKKGEGLSGRALRKIPFQAHAFFAKAGPDPPAKFSVMPLSAQ